jgi:hypothetical protein
MYRGWIPFVLLGVVILSSVPLASADTFGGIPGQDYGDYSSYNTHDYSTWPAAYKDLCDQHMRAVIKRCSVDAKAKGYDNWLVTRMRGSTLFTPTRSGYSAQDVILGGNKCTYNENTDDEVYISSVILTFMCSEFQGGSDQYACSFSCAAWDCENDVDLYSVSACSAYEESASPNPFTKMTVGCKQQTEELCAARGPNCQLEQPCYYYDYDRKLVHCDCSCPDTIDPSTLTQEQLTLAESEAFNLDTFNWEAWKEEHPGPCDPVLSTVKEKGALDTIFDALITIKDTGGRVVGFITDGVKTVLDKSSLPFTKLGGLIGASKNGQVLIVVPNGNGPPNINGINPTADGPASLMAGVNTALPYQGAENTFNLLGPPETNQEVAEETQNACPLPTCGLWGSCTNDVQTRICEPLPVGCPAPPTKQACSPCQEIWTCDEYGVWGDWSACVNNSQSQTRTRVCTDSNACGTTVTKPIELETGTQTCTPANCTESWSCGEYGGWSAWGECQSNSTQTHSKTRTCTDANACGTTISKPTTTETETQACTYVPPKPYHEKTEYLTLASGATAMSLGTMSNVSIPVGGSTKYTFAMTPGKAYQISVTITGGTGTTPYVLQQQYGPPQLTYEDPAPGVVKFSGGPDVATYGDTQHVAIEIGPPTGGSPVVSISLMEV